MAGRQLRRPQRGTALLIFMVLLVTAALTYVVTSLTQETTEALREKKTQEALMQARDALIGYALKYREDQIQDGQYDRVYGYLPLPDLGTHRNNNLGCVLEGCDASNFAGNALNTSVMGRLPWRTLGLPPLRDGNGECLWLIVSGSHQRLQRISPMNWDTPGQLDIVIANGANVLNSTIASAHDRPVAVIFSPGPILPGQDRSPSAVDSVTQCGGNYDAANYLDPGNAIAGVTNYLAATNHASVVTGAPNAPKQILTQGKIYEENGKLYPNACPGNACALVVNDAGLAITADALFDTLRKSSSFLSDINAMLDRMVSCLRDEIVSGSSPSAYDRIAGADTHACYGQNSDPLGYYPHFKEMIFVAKPTTRANVTVDGIAQSDCAGALIFSGQRGTGQQRITAAEKNTFPAAYANYLEGSNLLSFNAAGSTGDFSGAGQLERTAGNGQAKNQDIVRCIPTGASFSAVESTALASLGIGQLSAYNAVARTLTLGRQYAITSTQRSSAAGAFFGCSWTPETHAFGSGFRSYFKFQIIDSGHGFSFAAIDGANGTHVCGAEAEQLGYSGDNGTSPAIAPPKIGIEIDTSKNASRSDPSPSPSNQYGHLAIVYWGTHGSPDDDNVHGVPIPPDTAARPAPRNPPAEDATVAGSGIAHLPGSSLPTKVNLHLRIEVTRISTNETLHSSAYRVDAWLVKGDSMTAIIAAMRNTTRPMTQLYPSVNAVDDVVHLHDEPTIYDLQGGSCSTDTPCPNSNQVCGTDNLCYTKSFDTVRLGFTTAQSATTATKDQEINISDFAATWIP